MQTERMQPEATHRLAQRRQRARARWLRVHRWLGLGLLVFWLIIGFTGSVLVLYRDVLMALHPAPAVVGTAEGIDLDRIQQALRHAHPQRTGPWRIELPLAPDEAVVARYMKPAESAGQAFAPLMVWVSPHQAEVIHSAIWGREPLTWLYDLHYSLLLDLNGRQLVGIIGVLMMVSLCSGLVLWWPRQASWAAWRRALAFKRQAAIQRRVYDWHKLTGLASAALLLMLAFTGAVLTWHAPIEGWLQRVSPLYAAPPMPRSGPVRISLMQAVALARARFPDARVRWVETAPAAGGHIRVQLWQAGEPSLRFPKTNVWVDAATGKVRAVRDVRLHGAGDVFMAWLHPLHSGEVAGWPGRIVVLLAGLAPPLLALTGWARWRHKRRAAASLPITGPARTPHPAASKV
jgi:uncharacterized iron-regulated membrane protein